MDELRSYIQENRELFETEAPPQGHQARFEERLAKSGLKRKRPGVKYLICLLYTSPSPRDRTRSRMPSSA